MPVEQNPLGHIFAYNLGFYALNLISKTECTLFIEESNTDVLITGAKVTGEVDQQTRC